MQSITHVEEIETFSTRLQTVKDKVKEIQRDTENYVKFIKSCSFEVTDTSDQQVQQQIGAKKMMLEQMMEIKRRKESLMREENQLIPLLDQLKEEINGLLSSHESVQTQINDIHKQMAQELIELKTMAMNEEIEKIKNKYTREIESIQKDLESPENGIQEVERRHLAMNGIISKEEMIQLESWTGMNCGEVIFDSDKDIWDAHECVFDQKVMERQHLIMLIEDTTENMFGGYLNVKIEKYSYWKDRYGQENFKWHNDPNSFVFNIRSQGRLSGMMKFDMIPENSHEAFRLYTNSDAEGDLFEMGRGDLRVRNKSRTSDCYALTKYTYDYNDIPNALCGTELFTVKRVCVIQMI